MKPAGRIENLNSLTPELLIKAYASGVFPMAEDSNDPAVFWVDPDERGILPLEAFHVPRSLRKTVRRGAFDVRFNTAFREVIEHCAEATPGRRDTWINGPILDTYLALHVAKVTHSVECWLNDRLVGGLYGVALGGAFFGESMFSRVTDASKVALVHLVARLRVDGFCLLDVQFITQHLRQFGTIAIPRKAYHKRLNEALFVNAKFQSEPLSPAALEGCWQSITQTS